MFLHFGGPEGSIDAYTLAEALIGFADMARAISATVDPGTYIEFLVEATGPGSYRTRIRRIKRDYGGLLKIGGAVFWGIVSSYIYDNYVKNDPPPQVTVTEDGTIIKTANIPSSSRLPYTRAPNTQSKIRQFIKV